MKYFLWIIFLFLFNSAYAQISPNENSLEKNKGKMNIHIDPYLGTFTNSTFGTHFSFYIGVSLGFKEKNKIGFAYEKLFGDSKNEYQVLGDSEMFRTKEFGQKNSSLFYDRILLENSKNILSAYLAISHDRIKIEANEYIAEDKLLQGIGYEFGLSYDRIFKEKHHVPIMLIYHISKINNKLGTNINQNYIGLRFIYSYGGVI